MTQERYGAVLRLKRMARGMQVEELAELVGCKPQSITDFESNAPNRGRMPLPELRGRIAAVLGNFYEERIMVHKEGFFISFESTSEGVGKTTQVKRLAENLRAAGVDTVQTRELGGTAIGQKLRAMLLEPENKLAEAAELFIVMADRAQHYSEVVKPALEQGKVVVSDRFFDTSLVYQGWGRGWKEHILRDLHHHATGSLIPDLTIVLDGTPYRTIPNDDRFERLGDGFFDKIKRGMLDIVSKNPERCVLLNANEGDETYMAQKIFQVVQERLALLQN